MVASSPRPGSPSTDRPERSRNAKAQARHRAKRKAYITQLEHTVSELRQTVSGPDIGANPMRMRMLENENARLRQEVERLNNELSAFRGTASPQSPTSESSSSTRRALDAIYESSVLNTYASPTSAQSRYADSPRSNTSSTVRSFMADDSRSSSFSSLPPLAQNGATSPTSPQHGASYTYSTYATSGSYQPYTSTQVSQYTTSSPASASSSSTTSPHSAQSSPISLPGMKLAPSPTIAETNVTPYTYHSSGSTNHSYPSETTHSTTRATLPPLSLATQGLAPAPLPPLNSAGYASSMIKTETEEAGGYNSYVSPSTQTPYSAYHSDFNGWSGQRLNIHHTR